MVSRCLLLPSDRVALVRPVSDALIGRMFITQPPITEIQVQTGRSDILTVKNSTGVVVNDILVLPLRAGIIRGRSWVINGARRRPNSPYDIFVDESNRLKVE